MKSAASTEIGHRPEGWTGEEDWDFEEQERDTTCGYCAGTGGDPWNDGILPCPICDGEGYRWWE